MRERLSVLHRYEEEKEEGEEREVKEKGCFGGTKKPDEEERAREKGKQFCQLKPFFQLQKAAFCFVIPLVISADIRTQKMWVSGECWEVKSHPPVGNFKNLLPGFGTLIL